MHVIYMFLRDMKMFEPTLDAHGVIVMLYLVWIRAQAFKNRFC